MRTVRMRSLKKHPYGRKVYKEGEEFNAQESHVKIITALGRAVKVDVETKATQKPAPKAAAKRPRGRPRKKPVIETVETDIEHIRTEDIRAEDVGAEDEPSNVIDIHPVDPEPNTE